VCVCVCVCVVSCVLCVRAGVTVPCRARGGNLFAGVGALLFVEKMACVRDRACVNDYITTIVLFLI